VQNCRRRLRSRPLTCSRRNCDSELLLGWIAGLQSNLDDTEAAAAGAKQQLDGTLRELAAERHRLVEVAATLKQVGCCC
jgi:hypothetical protein